MTTYARWLFGAAAVFNFAVAAGLLFMNPILVQVLQFDPARGSNLMLLHLVCAFVALFGYAYVLVAIDPVKHRVFIPFAVIGKLLAAAIVVWAWAAGDVPWTFPPLGGGDVAFAVLFIDYLRRTRAT